MSAYAPPACGYERASSLLDACEQLRDTEGAILLAGGTDVVPMRAGGTLEPTLLVDIKHVQGMSEVNRLEDGTLAIGSCVTMAQLAASSEPASDALGDGATVVGGPPTRNRATLGGNVCRSSPAGDTLPALLVLDSSVRLVSAAGDREVPIDSFFTGPGTNVIERGEVLDTVLVPPRTGASAYRRLTYRAWLDLAVLGVAARVELADDTCVDAAVAIGGVATTPKLVPEASSALIGTSATSEDIAVAADACVALADPIDDVRGTRSYRLRALRVLADRVVGLARRRAVAGRPAGGRSQ